MVTFFLDYQWKNGKPVGRQAAMPSAPLCYKIVADPYYKRISVECYREGKWDSLIYDSVFLDFRRLNERDQLAWQKEILPSSSVSEADCLIRDQDDRVVFLEKHQLKDGVSVSCKIFSPHGTLLAHQEMHYVCWGAAFNGVTLSDSTGRLALKKVYAFDEQTFQFTDLLAVVSLSGS